MHSFVVAKILGMLLMLFSTTLLPPLLVSLIYQDGNSSPFISAWLIIFISGASLWLSFRRANTELRYRDGFLIVVLFWTVLAIVGAVPLYLSHTINLGITDSFFESMSGLTTTGATVITGLDSLPKSILFYRAQLQWLGGIGIIVLAVAIMPMLGIGGMQLYRAETPGPMKNSKLTPRITETAKALWYIYVGLTVICSLAYWLAGMDFFDALTHSFSTVAIGGFSTYDQSLGHFDSVAIEMVAIVFMIIAAINFSLHFVAWRSRSFLGYLKDREFRAFIGLLCLGAFIILGLLLVHGTFSSLGETTRYGLFHIVSIATTTGFTSTGFHWWPTVAPVLLIFMSFVGGCAGSTAGGIKVLRVLLLYKQGSSELVRLVHPRAQLSIKLGANPISSTVMNSVWAFFSLYILSFGLIGVVLCALGIDWITAFSAAAACLNNLGPGLGNVASHYGELADTAKWVLAFAMLLGRLELFTLLVLFTATFWRN
jgi:trk system potassium uptake protein TrkH